MRISFLLSLIFFVFSSTAYGKVDYSKKWFTKESDHFQVIHNAEQGHIANKVLNYAELSYENLQSYFLQFPELTRIVLNDQTDLANGSATVFPYPLIKLNTALPSYETSIGEYGDWYYELILHEYVHILNMYPANSKFSILNSLFGSIMSPNMLLPRWSTEGLAVAIETRSSNGGRLRSQLFQAYARALTIDSKWSKHLNPVELNETDLLSYPYGMRPYYFGALFWNYVIDQKGKNAVLEFNEEMAASLPYLHDMVLHETSQIKEDYVFRSSYEKIEKAAKIQLKSLNTEFRKSEKLVIPKHTSFMVKTAPDKSETAVIRKNIDSSFELYFLKRKKIALTADAISSFSWSPNSRKLLITKLATHNNLYSKFETIEYDISTAKSKIIENSLSIRENHYSPDHSKIISLSSENGTQKLWVAKKNNSEWKWDEILNFDLGERLSFVQWIDNENIIYLAKGNSKSQQIFSKNILTKKTKAILSFIPKINYLKYSNGQIYFTSSHSGVTNLYRTKSPYNNFEKILDTKTMILDADVSNKSHIFWINELGSNGFQLKKIKLSNKPVNKDRKLGALLFNEENTEVSKTELSKQEYKSDRYKLTNSLAPKYWYPWISPLADGLLVQVTTGGKDALGIHSYSVSMGYDSFSNKANSSLSYLNHAYSWDTSLQYSKFSQNLIAAGTKIDRERGGFGFTNYIFKDTNKWTWNLKILGDKNQQALDPSRVFPQFFLRYSDLGTQRGHQIGTPSGNKWSLGLSSFAKLDKTDAFQVLHSEGSYFYSEKLPKYHSLQLSFKYDKRSNNSTDIYASLVSGGGNFTDLGIPQFHLNRGYAYSQFLAWSMLTMNTEYKFPLWYIFDGPRKAPVYFKKLYGKLVFDYSLFDGFFYNQKSKAYSRDQWKTSFATLGAEISLETKVGYLLPLYIHLGAYYGFQEDASGDLKGGLRITMPIF